MGEAGGLAGFPSVLVGAVPPKARVRAEVVRPPSELPWYSQLAPVVSSRALETLPNAHLTPKQRGLM